VPALESEVVELLPNSVSPPAPEADLVRHALENPVGARPLADLARGRDSAIILISCRTRRTGSPVFVPEMVATLNAAGIPDGRITVYTATGTHDNFRPEDAELLLGSDIARRVKVMGHDCHTPEKLVEVGITSRGTRVRLNRTYLDADLKIAAGRVTYHYFAGFSAGRKSILPGVSAFDTIVQNHSMALIREGDVRPNPHTRNGNLATNPIHLDMVEAARMAPPDFTFVTACNTKNQITHAFGGDVEQAHMAGVDAIREVDSPVVDRPADLLLMSCGGAPNDCNGVQMIKAVLNNWKVVRRGGVIILAAECPEGTARWLIDACSIADLDELKRQAAERRIRHAHNPFWIREAREHASVILVTKLPDADMAALGFGRAPDLESALKMAEDLSGKPRLTYVVPYGNTTYVRLRQSDADSHSTR
jgi:lactate racemase